MQQSWGGSGYLTLPLGWRCQEEFKRCKRSQMYPRVQLRRRDMTGRSSPRFLLPKGNKSHTGREEKPHTHQSGGLRDTWNKASRNMSPWNMEPEHLCQLHSSEEQGQGLEEAAHGRKTSAQNSCPTPSSHGPSCLLAPLPSCITLGNSTLALGCLSDVYIS